MAMFSGFSDFPIKNGDFPWQNVSSPEGISISPSRCGKSHMSAGWNPMNSWGVSPQQRLRPGRCPWANTIAWRRPFRVSALGDSWRFPCFLDFCLVRHGGERKWPHTHKRAHMQQSDVTFVISPALSCTLVDGSFKHSTSQRQVGFFTWTFQTVQILGLKMQVPIRYWNCCFNIAASSLAFTEPVVLWISHFNRWLEDSGFQWG